MFAVLIHIYNHDSWERIFKEQLKSLQSYSPVIMINFCITNPGNAQIISDIKADFHRAYIITTPNKGKDIGGKLALIDFFIKTRQQSEYIVFLHDKTSPHSITGERWRRRLFTIIDHKKVKTIIKEFQKNPRLGVIGAGDFIKNEYDKRQKEFETTNNNKLKELIATYKIKLTNYLFIAGTMFWIKSEIIRKFFSLHSPLECREVLEEGNFTDQYEGTYTHSWERIFCWLANDQGYLIKGV